MWWNITGDFKHIAPGAFPMLNWTCTFISKERLWKCFHRMHNAAHPFLCCNQSSNSSQWVSERQKSCGLHHEFNTQRLFFSFIVCVKQKIILLYALIIAFFHFSWMGLRLQEEMSFYLRKLPNSSILIRSKSSIDLWNCQAVFSLASFSLNGNFISRKPGNIKCHQWST